MSGEVLYSTLSSSPILSIQVVTSNASNVILYAPSGGTWHCIGVPVSASNAANGLYNVRLTTNVAGGSVVISSATGATALCFRVA
jgi:hypothetical protein